MIRADDNEETVKSRLDAYVRQTKPLTDYYKKSGLLKDVDASGSIDEVFARITEALK